MIRSVPRLSPFILLLAGASAGSASASSIPWVGTGDYTAAPSSVGDEAVVGPFNMFDLHHRSGAIIDWTTDVDGSLDASVGDIFTVYFQTHVVNHLDVGGTVVPSPGLNSTYELTVTTVFTEVMTGFDLVGGVPTATFDVLGGEAFMYFDSTRDARYIPDIGFTDGDVILHASITGGDATVSNPFPGALTGGVTVDFSVDFFDASVFGPDPITGGLVEMTFRDPSRPLTSVLGVIVDNLNDAQVAGDGTVYLHTVPIPAPFWLLGTAMAGVMAVARRRSMSRGV